MLNDDKRDLIKAQDHLIELCRIISQLQDDAMAPRRYAETMLRLQKRAHLAAQRIGKIAGRELTVFDRRDFDKERHPQLYQNNSIGNHMSWIVQDNPNEVTPIDDLKPHKAGADCWCNPIVDDDIIIHNAMDKREKYEDGTLLLS